MYETAMPSWFSSSNAFICLLLGLAHVLIYQKKKKILCFTEGYCPYCAFRFCIFIQENKQCTWIKSGKRHPFLFRGMSQIKFDSFITFVRVS